MFGAVTPKVADKANFLAVASQMMRRILVDYARTKASGKRGGDLRQVDAAGLELGTDQRDFLPLLELDRALDQLAVENPVFARAIEMRYFGGLTAEEAAEVTGRSVHYVLSKRSDLSPGAKVLIESNSSEYGRLTPINALYCRDLVQKERRRFQSTRRLRRTFPSRQIASLQITRHY